MSEDNFIRSMRIDNEHMRKLNEIHDFKRNGLMDSENAKSEVERLYHLGFEDVKSNVDRKFRQAIAKLYKIAARRGIENSVNVGAVFSKMRNCIGHGKPEKFEDIHVYTFMLARCLIYIMILDSAGIDSKRIKTIIHKLFR